MRELNARLNPSFNGIPSRASEGITKYLITSLNPSFNGIPSRAKTEKEVLHDLFAVLILLLMEYPLGL